MPVAVDALRSRATSFPSKVARLLFLGAEKPAHGLRE
jgi:hypothetical protein